MIDRRAGKPGGPPYPPSPDPRDPAGPPPPPAARRPAGRVARGEDGAALAHTAEEKRTRLAVPAAGQPPGSRRPASLRPRLGNGFKQACSLPPPGFQGSRRAGPALDTSFHGDLHLGGRAGQLPELPYESASPGCFVWLKNGSVAL